MAHSIQLVQCFYIEVPGKPDKGVKVLNVLGEAGVNLLVFSRFPKGRRAQIAFIPADPTIRQLPKKLSSSLRVPRAGSSSIVMRLLRSWLHWLMPRSTLPHAMQSRLVRDDMARSCG
jgi:hypothetical protein